MTIDKASHYAPASLRSLLSLWCFGVKHALMKAPSAHSCAALIVGCCPMPGTKIGGQLSRLMLVAVALAVVAGVVWLGIGLHKRSVLQTESKSFADSAALAIASTWNKNQLLERATPKLRSSLKPADLRGFSMEAGILGPFGAYLGAKDQMRVSYGAAFGGPVSASYVATARYLNGLAKLHIGLVKRDGRWMIDAFKVDDIVLGPPGPSLIHNLFFD